MFDGILDAFFAGGFIMWPLLAIAVAILLQAARAGAALRSRDGDPEPTRRRTASVLFWGFMAALLGLIGTFVGIAQIASAVQAAGGVSPALAWGGVGVSLVPTLFGLVILFVAALLWFALRGRLLGGGAPA